MKEQQEIKYRYVWATLENSDATSTLKQHAFVSQKMRRMYTMEIYEGNKSACGHVYAASDDESRMNIDDIEQEEFDQYSACKICIKRIKKLIEK